MGTSLTIIWKYGRILLQQSSVNVSYPYYSAKLLASSPSRLQIMSVLFLGKLVSLNIRVAKFKHRLFHVFVLTPTQHYEENLSFTNVNNFANDSKKKNQKLTRFLSGWLFIYTFCQFLQVDYLRAKNFTGVCKMQKRTADADGGK